MILNTLKKIGDKPRMKSGLSPFFLSGWEMGLFCGGAGSLDAVDDGGGNRDCGTVAHPLGE